MVRRLKVSVAFVTLLFILPYFVVRAQTSDGASTSTPTFELESTIDPVEQVIDQETEEVVETTDEEVLMTSFQDVELGTSTPPEIPIEQKPDALILQPAVYFSTNGAEVSARIVLENLTCRYCDRAAPSVPVEIYYVEWYPNDGEDRKNLISTKNATHLEEVEALTPWAKTELTWATEDIPAGKYYFIVEVDPGNEHGAYGFYRSEFIIK